MANWVDNKDFNPSIITNALENIKTINSNGEAIFSGFELSDLISILDSMLKLHHEITEHDRRKIIQNGVFKVGQGNTLTSDLLLKEFSVLENEFLRQTKQTFRLVTNISVKLATTPKIFIVDNSRISFGWRQNHRIALAREKIIEEAQRHTLRELPKNYTNVSVIVQARSTEEAGRKALDNLDFLRAIWNLWKNLQIQTRRSYEFPRPINAVILGPIHTLHKLNGESASDNWWYDTNYRKPVSVLNEFNQMQEIYKFTKAIRSNLNKLNYKQELIFALIQYTRALDSSDWNNSFLQLWSILEKLTGTTQSDSHKTTIKRASFIFYDNDFAFQALHHLRTLRNIAIHSGTQKDDIETTLYQLKRVIEGLFMFHIRKPNMFKSMSEAADFMDSPKDLNILDSKIRKLKTARKFLSK